MTYLGTGDLCIHSNTTDGSTTFVDSSINNYTITTNGSTHSTTQAKFGASSIEFLSINDYLRITKSDSTFNFGTADFTIDFWVWKSSYAGIAYFLDIGSNNVFFRTNAGGIDLYAGGSYIFQGLTPPSINTWHHIALTRSSGVFKLYINGVLISTQSTKLTNNFGTNSNLTIGNYSTGSYYLNGYIDEFRIVKNQVVWTANFTPPIQIYSDATYKLSGYTKINDTAISTSVRLYNNANGTFIADITSDENGFFEYNTLASNDTIDVVAISPNTQYNDMVYRVTPILVV